MSSKSSADHYDTRLTLECYLSRVDLQGYQTYSMAQYFILHDRGVVPYVDPVNGDGGDLREASACASKWYVFEPTDTPRLSKPVSLHLRWTHLHRPGRTRRLKASIAVLSISNPGYQLTSLCGLVAKWPGTTDLFELLQIPRMILAGIVTRELGVRNLSDNQLHSSGGSRSLRAGSTNIAHSLREHLDMSSSVVIGARHVA